MEDVVAKYGWKKVGIFLAIISLAIVVFLLSSIMQSNTKTLPGTKANPSSAPVSKSGGYESEKTPSQETKVPLAKSYTTPFYTISYPKNYSASDSNIVSGILNATKVSDSSKGAQIEINVWDSGVTSAPLLMQKYKTMPFSRRSATFGSYSGFEMEGVFRGKPKNLYERVVVLENQKKVLEMIFDYQAPQKDKTIESEFDSILSSLE